MVRLKEIKMKLPAVAMQFQFLNGSIKSGIYFPAFLFQNDFNSLMVRLKVYLKRHLTVLNQDFNSLMVRLKVTSANAYYNWGNIISIP